MFNVYCTTRRIKTVQGISHAQHILQYFKRSFPFHQFIMTDKRMRQPLPDVHNRDETIRSSHDTIRIDTKGDDIVIFDTIRYG